MDDRRPRDSFRVRHGMTRSVLLRLGLMVALVMVVGIRFQRTFVAIAVCAVFLAVTFALGRSPNDSP
jgi:hypothetical protein